MDRPIGLMIVDYNLSRIDDVRKIFDYAKDAYGYRSVLVRSQPTPQDTDMADFVIDLDPLLNGFVEQCIVELNRLDVDVRAGLVFSDNAVHTGALILKKIGCCVDSPTMAIHAFCKEKYRSKENVMRSILEPQGFFVPHYKKITRKKDLEEFVAASPGGVVVKPTAEGNNRGVMLIDRPNMRSIELAMHGVEPYLSGGAMVEERIPFNDEYSFDGVGKLSFITQKFSATGEFPVEYGQMVPAEINEARSTKIQLAGQVANLICGQAHGPFHNEVRVSPDDEQVSVVEPNRRPAGMKIWDLAERVYGVSFYQKWVDAVCEGNIAEPLPAPKGTAMLLQLPSVLTITKPKLWVNVVDVVDIFWAQAQSYLADRGTAAVLDAVHLDKPQHGYLDYPPRDNTGFYGSVQLYFPEARSGVEKYFWPLQTIWANTLSEYLGLHSCEAVS